MNKGICMSSGDIIGILNSDDFYEQDTLQNIGECVESEPNIDIYYGYLRVLMSDSNELQVYRYNYENYLGKLGSGCESAAQHPTCFIRRALYDKIGLYNLTYRTAADYDFLLRAKLHGARFKALPVVLTNFRTGGVSSNTSDFEREDQRFRTHFDNGLISEREFRVHLNRQKYRKIKILKSKIFRLFTKTYI
jgi:glycosyltransferase involved in cell wall biosynthesis